MTRQPDRLDVDKSDRKLYDHSSLSNEIFVGKTRKEQFIFAMAIGFRNKIKRSIEVNEGFFLAKDLRPEEESLINTIAIFDSNSIDILLDKETVYMIAEEYAHAGIRLLYDKVTSGQPGSFFKRIELDLNKLLENPNLRQE